MERLAEADLVWLDAHESRISTCMKIVFIIIASIIINSKFAILIVFIVIDIHHDTSTGKA